jgi:hypothetical protein
MAMDILVFAPAVDDSIIHEMSLALSSVANTAASVSGYYGNVERRSAAHQDLSDLIRGLDLNHYWAIINVHMKNMAPDVLKIAVGAVIKESIDWAKNHGRGKQVAKIRLYGPDGRLLSDEDV